MQFYKHSNFLKLWLLEVCFWGQNGAFLCLRGTHGGEAVGLPNPSDSPPPTYQICKNVQGCPQHRDCCSAIRTPSPATVPTSAGTCSVPNVWVILWELLQYSVGFHNLFFPLCLECVQRGLGEGGIQTHCPAVLWQAKVTVCTVWEMLMECCHMFYLNYFWCIFKKCVIQEKIEDKSTPFTISGLTPSTTYCLKVQAYPPYYNISSKFSNVTCTATADGMWCLTMECVTCLIKNCNERRIQHIHFHVAVRRNLINHGILGCLW